MFIKIRKGVNCSRHYVTGSREHRCLKQLAKRLVHRYNKKLVKAEW